MVAISNSALKATVKLGGFGFRGGNSDAAHAKMALDFEDDDNTSRKLEKLPTPPFGQDDDDAALANTAATYDADSPMNEPLESEPLAPSETMARAPSDSVSGRAGDPVHENRAAEDREMPDSESKTEDIDPLDAYMSEIAKADVFDHPMSNNTVKAATMQPVALFGDNDDDDADDLEALEAEDFMALANKKKKKELKDVDHKKIVYPEFRKEFYVEPVETKEMSEEDVANLRFELDGIKIRGKNVPKPVLTWGQCGLLTPVLTVIAKLKYKAPTPIQAQSIPAIMAGRDVIGVAKTGSGKTIAFLMPMFRHIKDQPPLKALDGPIAIILAPTRELANQIHGETKPFVSALGLKSAVCYGQQSLKDNIDALKKGVEIIVATPGRLVDLATVNQGRLLNFRRVTFFVMDEADRLWDMGFEPQVMKLLNQVRPDRQCIMFSATFPKNMEALARKVLRHPVEIIVGGRSVVAPEVKQIIEVRAQDTKFHRLLEILGEVYADDEDVRTLVFVERQETADDLLSHLLKKFYPCGSIHGGKDQVDRTTTIEDFKAGVAPIMIATSVAARGLDVKQLKLVVNFDTPSHLEDYVHRVGRTGRAGETGTAITFITEDQDRYAVDLVKALKNSEQEIPEPLQKLADGFLQKVKDGKAKASSAGFGGKGLDKIDAARSVLNSSLRKQYKTGDEPVEEDEEEKKLDAKILATATGTATTRRPSVPELPSGLNLDLNFSVHKTEKPSASKDPLEAVRLAAANIDSRLTHPGRLRPGQPIDNRGPDAGAYHVRTIDLNWRIAMNANGSTQATLEINDFPQKARVSASLLFHLVCIQTFHFPFACLLEAPPLSSFVVTIANVCLHSGL